MNVLRRRSTSMLGDGGDAGTDKVMQKYGRHCKEKNNYRTCSQGLNIISRHIWNSLRSNAACSYIGSTRKGLAMLDKKQGTQTFRAFRVFI